MCLHIVGDNLKHLPEARVMCLHIVRDNLKHLPEARVMCPQSVLDTFAISSKNTGDVSTMSL